MTPGKSSEFKVTVGITTRNRPEPLRQALESAFRQTLRPLEVLVVDDASEPPLEPLTAPSDISLRWWRHEQNQGLVEARNGLMAQARGRYFVSLDDDAYFTRPDDLQTAYDCLEGNPQLAVLSFKTITPRDLAGLNTKRMLTTHRPCSVFRGGAHMLRLSVLSKTGNYRGFFFIVGEETDLAYRIWDAGYEVSYFPQVQLVHDQTGAGKKYLSKRWAYFYVRNGLFTIWLNQPWLFQCLSIPKFFVNTLIMHWRHHLLAPFFQGCLHAFREIPSIRKFRRPVSYRTMLTLLNLRRKFGDYQWD